MYKRFQCTRNLNIQDISMFNRSFFFHLFPGNGSIAVSINPLELLYDSVLVTDLAGNLLQDCPGVGNHHGNEFLRENNNEYLTKI